jgi:hypothetical protein
LFEADDSPGLLSLALPYVLQLFCLPPIIMLAGVPFSALLSILGLSGEHPSHTKFGGYEALVCLFVGTFVGWMIGRKVPSFVPSGRWIGVLPAIVVFPPCSGKHFEIPVDSVAARVFLCDRWREGIAVYLFTLPAFSAVGYSIGTVLVGTKSKCAKLTNLSPISTAAIGASLFSIFALLAHQFEDSKIESWSRVRTVIDRPGLRLAPDANRLCSDRTSDSGLLLQTGIMVEGLERRVCFKGQVLDMDAPRPPDSWSVERVKALSGSSTRAAGWVLAYGLRETMNP